MFTTKVAPLKGLNRCVPPAPLLFCSFLFLTGSHKGIYFCMSCSFKQVGLFSLGGARVLASTSALVWGAVGGIVNHGSEAQRSGKPIVERDGETIPDRGDSVPLSQRQSGNQRFVRSDHRGGCRLKTRSGGVQKDLRGSFSTAIDGSSSRVSIGTFSCGRLAGKMEAGPVSQGEDLAILIAFYPESPHVG